MKYDATDCLLASFKKLKPELRAAFTRVVREKSAAACDAWAAAQVERNSYVWPKSLRVDEWVCRWRRVGDHGVYDAP